MWIRVGDGKDRIFNIAVLVRQLLRLACLPGSPSKWRKPIISKQPNFKYSYEIIALSPLVKMSTTYSNTKKLCLLPTEGIYLLHDLCASCASINYRRAMCPTHLTSPHHKIKGELTT